MHPRRGPARSAIVVGIALLGCLALALSGCGGSALSPSFVREANVAPAGSGQATTSGGGTGTTVAAASAGSTAAPAGGTSGVGSGSGGGSVATTVGGSKATTGGHTVLAATGSTKAASCAGFANQTGVTSSTITLANVSDITGPVPGIFTSAQQAVKAYVAYFNATSSLCGRKLSVLSLDSRTDAGADQQAYTTACSQAFAAVGSMSAFDSGGASTAQGCGLPDIRSQAVSDARNACTTCFGAQATQMNAFQNAVPDFFVKHYHAATQHAAMIYVDAAASVQNALNQEKVEIKRGMHFVYNGSFDVAEFNYSPYVQKMKQAGVRWVQFVGSSDEAVHLEQAMQSANFTPQVFLLDPTAYDPTFVTSGGSAVDGSFVFLNFTPFEEAAHNPELRLYESWLHQVAPGAAPTYFGVFAWSAARLFVQEAVALGGKLTRKSLVSRVRGVHAWTSNGLHAPQNVGGKTNGSCWRFVRLEHGRWDAVGGTSYLCDGSTLG